MRATLARLVHRCHGDDRPDCPILDDLAGEPAGDHSHSMVPGGFEVMS